MFGKQLVVACLVASLLLVVASEARSEEAQDAPVIEMTPDGILMTNGGAELLLDQADGSIRWYSRDYGNEVVVDRLSGSGRLAMAGTAAGPVTPSGTLQNLTVPAGNVLILKFMPTQASCL